MYLPTYVFRKSQVNPAVSQRCTYIRTVVKFAGAYCIVQIHEDRIHRVAIHIFLHIYVDKYIGCNFLEITYISFTCTISVDSSDFVWIKRLTSIQLCSNSICTADILNLCLATSERFSPKQTLDE
jgi:hypothetical protein